MYETGFLHEKVDSWCPSMHRRRRTALVDAVARVLTGAKLTVTSLGRAVASNLSHKHSVKRMDRLVGNRHLAKESVALYRGMAAEACARLAVIPVLIDWTENARTGLAMLEASLPVSGRGLTLWRQTYCLRSLKNPRVQERFLRRLKAILPAGKRVIVITDAGFQLSFFKTAEALGFDWVMRLGNSVLVQREGDTGWRRPDEVSMGAKAKPQSLGHYEIGKQTTHRLTARLCVVRGRRRGRQDRPNNREHGHGTMERKYRALHTKAWVLATSLSEADADAGQVVAWYRQRMQIEEMFRDVKSHRFGSGLDYAGSRDPARMDVLRLIGSIALFFACLLGLAARRLQLDRQLQVNTVRDRAVLSWYSLGRWVASKLLRGKEIKLLEQILQTLQQHVLAEWIPT